MYSDARKKARTRWLLKKYSNTPKNKLRIFVAKEGLHISVKHPDNLGIEDDFLSFVLYELVDVK